MTRPLSRSVVLGLSVVLALATAWAALCMLSNVLQSAVSFDGAMNLQVSASIANGDGYRRSLIDSPAFPHEVETNYPFTIPAAIVFRLLGVNLFTSELINALYIVALLVVIHIVVTRFSPQGSRLFSPWSCLAILACISRPEFVRFGTSGYGEVPALFWLLLGCVFLFALPEGLPQPGPGRLFAGGLCIGLSVATKTVLLIGAGSVGLTLLIFGWRESARPWRTLSVQVLLFTLGVIAAILPFEIWRFITLGDHGYALWWTEQFVQVSKQAGIKSGFQDTPSLFEKFNVHFAALAKLMGVSLTQLWGLLVSELGAVFYALFVWHDRRSRRLLVVLSIGVVVYFVWWLLITPTQKAWLRRLLDGLLLLHIGAAAGLAAGWLHARANRSWGGGVIMTALLAAILIFHYSSIAQAINRVPRSAPPENAREIVAVANWLKTLDRDELVFAEGWYSAPVISLYAARPVADLNDRPLMRLGDRRYLYLVADIHSLTTDTFAQVKASYQLEDLFPGFKNAKVYRMDRLRRKDVFAGALRQGLPSYVDFSQPQPRRALFGFNQENQPWRWVRCDAEALLTYDGAAKEFVVSAILPPREACLFKDGFHFSVMLNGVEIARSDGFGNGDRTFRVSIQNLNLKPGAVVRIGFQCDNVVNALFDHRQMAVRIRSFGFPPAGSDAGGNTQPR